MEKTVTVKGDSATFFPERMVSYTVSRNDGDVAFPASALHEVATRLERLEAVQGALGPDAAPPEAPYEPARRMLAEVARHEIAEYRKTHKSKKDRLPRLSPEDYLCIADVFAATRKSGVLSRTAWVRAAKRYLAAKDA